MYFIYKVLFNILNLLNLKSHPMNMLMKIINHILSLDKYKLLICQKNYSYS